MSITEKLKIITSNILQANSYQRYFDTVRELAEFYSLYTQIFYTSSNSFSKVKGGNAIHSADAANCINDYIRTALFIKGVHAAIIDLLKQKASDRVHILYAGCGPLGTLLIPVLSLVSNDKLDITFIDVHEQSTESIKQLVAKLNFSYQLIKVITGDACSYIPENKIDLLISETMLNALREEPQVSIISHLSLYLKSNAIIIPQNIAIAYIINNYSTFHQFNQTLPFASTQETGSFFDKRNIVFELNKNINIAYPSLYFESAEFEIDQNEGDIILLTSIQVYNDIDLHSGQSHITNPFCINHLQNFNGAGKYKFLCDFSQTPFWKLKKVI